MGYKVKRNERIIAEGHSLAIIECTDMPDDENRYFVMHSADDFSASLACAADTGELTASRNGETFRLTPVQVIFLQRTADKFDL